MPNYLVAKSLDDAKAHYSLAMEHIESGNNEFAKKWLVESSKSYQRAVSQFDILISLFPHRDDHSDMIIAHAFAVSGRVKAGFQLLLLEMKSCTSMNQFVAAIENLMFSREVLKHAKGTLQLLEHELQSVEGLIQKKEDVRQSIEEITQKIEEYIVSIIQYVERLSDDELNFEGFSYLIHQLNKLATMLLTDETLSGKYCERISLTVQNHLEIRGLNLADSWFEQAILQKEAGKTKSAEKKLDELLKCFKSALSILFGRCDMTLYAFVMSKQIKVEFQLLLLKVESDPSVCKLDAIKPLIDYRQRLQLIQSSLQLSGHGSRSVEDLIQKKEDVRQSIEEITQKIKEYIAAVIKDVEDLPEDKLSLEEFSVNNQKLNILKGVLLKDIELSGKYREQILLLMQNKAEKICQSYLNKVEEESSGSDDMTVEKKETVLAYLNSATEVLQAALKYLTPESRCEALHLKQLYIYMLSAKMSEHTSFSQDLIKYAKRYNLSQGFFSSISEQLQYLNYMMGAFFQLEGVSPSVVFYAQKIIDLSKHDECSEVDGFTDLLEQARNYVAPRAGSMLFFSRRSLERQAVKAVKQLEARYQLIERIEGGGLEDEIQRKLIAFSLMAEKRKHVGVLGVVDEHGDTLLQRVMRGTILSPDELVEMIKRYENPHYMEHDILLLLQYKDHLTSQDVSSAEPVMHVNNIHTLISRKIDLGERFQIQAAVDYIFSERSDAALLSQKVQVNLDTSVERLQQLAPGKEQIRSYAETYCVPPTTKAATGAGETQARVSSSSSGIKRGRSGAGLKEMAAKRQAFLFDEDLVTEDEDITSLIKDLMTEDEDITSFLGIP